MVVHSVVCNHAGKMLQNSDSEVRKIKVPDSL